VHLAADRACEVLACDGSLILLSLDGQSLAAAGGRGGIEGVEQLLELEATPCHEALHADGATLFSIADAPERFAEFAAMAGARGIECVLSVPLRHRSTVIGTMCFIRRSSEPFRTDTMQDAQKLADVVAASIVREQAHRAALAVTAQLQYALESRVVVEQAKGMVAAELGVSIDEALDSLRQFARSQRLRLSDVAGDIVTRKLPIALLRP
jgi:GAF domain-containing protein